MAGPPGLGPKRSGTQGPASDAKNNEAPWLGPTGLEIGPMPWRLAQSHRKAVRHQWLRRDLNPEPSGYEPLALTN